ncbi:MAG: RIP metalloprotease RseP [Flavipsychrobacter sp.]|nr:RIP metalloprotease RseP [Flavipsychrobacter sp.]
MQLNTVLLISGGGMQAIQILASLSFLIALHEFGHFFFARLFKTRVEKFYLFFDFLFPFSGLLNFSLFKKKVGDTEYGIGWFPLGGYVKIAGMVDESMDKEALKLPPQPWEYRSKKPWQRMFIMLGGIMVNVLVAMVLYMVIFSVWGEEYLPARNVKYGIATDSIARNMGLQNGDMIVALDGKPVERFDDITKDIILNSPKTINILRNGAAVDVPVTDASIKSIIGSAKDKNLKFIAPRIPMSVGALSAGSEAAKMGFKLNDSVLSVNGQPIQFFDEFQKAVIASTLKPVTVVVSRNGGAIDTLKGTVPETHILGIGIQNPARYFKTEKITYNPIQAVGKGFTYTFDKFGEYIQNFKLIFSPKVKASESLGGMITFAQLFPTQFDWYSFLTLTAFISIILAFMNLLPIPGLDGGYVIFLLFEMISGRKVNEKVMEFATTVGLVLLLGVMLYANGLDIFRLFKK